MAGLVKVLSIDGGGIRGIIPAIVLAEIEKRTGKRISELFDLIAGTSTGGILAVALAKPDGQGKPQYSAADLIGLYEEKGQHIFSRSVWHEIRAVGSLAAEKYPSDGIEGVLKKYFGETHLKDALTDVIVTSYDIERRQPLFFKSWLAKQDPLSDFPMRDVARATSAAPTYFAPAKIETEGPTDYYALIDGGVFANNPALCALADARIQHRDADDFLAVSLGTGQHTRTIPYDKAKDWGVAEWAQPILSVVFDGVSASVDYQMRELAPAKDGNPRYFRFQTELKMGNDDMDDASRTNIHVLKILAQEELIEKNDNLLTTLCSQLVSQAPLQRAAGGP